MDMLHKSFRVVQALLVVTSLSFLLCTTSAPVEPGDDVPLTMKLSLQRPGGTTAEFTGLPVTAILQFNDTVNFYDIVWNIGDAKMQIPVEVYSDSFAIPLYWLKTVPDSVDEETGYPYELISVKIGTLVSRTVRVNILNMAPIVDSIVVADTSIVVDRNVFGDNIYVAIVDTQQVCSMRVYAHELDVGSARTINASWRAIDSVRLSFNKVSTLSATYLTPYTNFRDTVRVKVYDGDEGEVNLAIVLLRTDGIPAVVIDSITFADTTFTDTLSFTHTYNTVSIDTARILVYSTSVQTGAVWRANFGPVTANPEAKVFTATYVCTLSNRNDTITTDSSFILDTVVVSLGNATGDTITKSIAIRKVPDNKRPVITAIYVNDELYADSAMWVLGGGFIDLRFTAIDPDGADQTNTLELLWSSGHMENFAANAGGVATYTTDPSPGYTDTLIATATDALGFSTSESVIVHVNLPPVLDSVYLNDKFYSNFSGAPVTFAATRLDTIIIKIHGHDPEYPDSTSVLPDTSATSAVTYMVTANNDLFLSKVDDNTYRYVPWDASYNERLVITVTDADGFETSQIFTLNVNNSRPSIDSILVNGTNFSSSAYCYTWQASVGDTLDMIMYVSDPDGNIASRTWTLNDSAVGSVSTIDPLFTQARYVAASDRKHGDSLFIAVEDSRGSKAEKCLFVNVNNQPPVIDSIRVGAITRATTGSQMLTYVSVAPDSLDLTVFAHEPDAGTMTYSWSTTSGVSGWLANQKTITYKGLDQAYVDTVTVIVTDDKNAADTRQIQMTFTK